MSDVRTRLDAIQRGHCYQKRICYTYRTIMEKSPLNTFMILWVKLPSAANSSTSFNAHHAFLAAAPVLAVL